MREISVALATLGLATAAQTATYTLSALIGVSSGLMAQSAPTGCKVDPIPKAGRGETITVTMHVVSDGTSCTLAPRVGTGRAESISIVERPKNGRVEVTLPAVTYTPTSAFAGTDTFLVAWFGTGFGPNTQAPHFRTRVEVEVAAKP